MTHNSTTTEMVLPGRQSAPRVLTVLPDFPFPATTGLHLRMVSNLELVRRLGCYSAVLYFSTEERDPVPIESTPLGEMCDEARHGGLRFAHARFSTFELIRHKLDFLLRGALGIPGRQYPFSMSYDRIGAAEIVLAEARRVRADFVVLPSFMLHYTDGLRADGFRVVADVIDVLAELTARFLSYGKTSIARMSLYSNYLASRTQERVFFPQCSEAWTTSPAEKKTVESAAPGLSVVVVANTLDEKLFSFGSLPEVENVGFIGTYSSLPNLQAARFLADQILPLVLKRKPKVRLKLAGANMPATDEAKFRGLPFVDLLGPISDSNELYRQCRVMALPVFVRGGVPLKIVEAFARGNVVVACPELTEGLPVRDGHDLLIRRDPTGFAEAIVNLLSDDVYACTLAKNARETFLKNWSRSHAEEVLRESSVLSPVRRLAQVLQ